MSKSMLYNYKRNKSCEGHKSWRYSRASKRNIGDWASSLSYHRKCMQQDELTYENAYGLARMYIKKTS